MEKIFKIYKAEIKSVDEEKFTVDAVVSTKKQDRDGDVILPEAFTKNLKVYKEHPVLLSSHNYSDLRKQIGEAVSVKITDSGLEAKFKYFSGLGNPEADWAWVLALKGIASFSIGFIGLESDPIVEKDKDGYERYVGRKFTNVELIEISQVLVPSNRGALQMSVERATEELELCDMVSKSFEGDVFIKQEAKPIIKAEKVEDKEFQWICNKCGKSFVKGQDEKELVCDCGDKCEIKKIDEKKHYTDDLVEKGDKSNPIPALKAEDVGEILSQTINKIFKGVL